MTATQLLLLAAWLVAIFGLRHKPTPVIIVIGAMLAGALVLLAFYFRPDVIPAYSGVLTPKSTLIFSAGNTDASAIPKLQIGTSNAIYGSKEIGRESPMGTILFPVLGERQFKIESIDGKMKVSVQIADDSGNIIAELIRNEWKIAPQPKTWDRNYTDDALEVKDSSGAVVLQVKVMPDRIQLQGIWWIDMGLPNGILRLIMQGNPTIGGQLNIVPKLFKGTLPAIDPMFVYPGDQHLGELRHG
ncbi:MAG: hypothetical protein HY067_21335 [Betaproteobacteria bacterium]|nr:hypothetical protein [Betaproteobacteria bacterium]